MVLGVDGVVGVVGWLGGVVVVGVGGVGNDGDGEVRGVDRERVTMRVVGDAGVDAFERRLLRSRGRVSLLAVSSSSWVLRLRESVSMDGVGAGVGRPADAAFDEGGSASVTGLDVWKYWFRRPLKVVVLLTGTSPSSSWRPFSVAIVGAEDIARTHTMQTELLAVCYSRI